MNGNGRVRRGGRQAAIARLGPWFHNLHLPDALQTRPDHPLGDFPAYKWAALRDHLPADLTGWSVLDIGCNAGFHSFELARRGARVTGLDVDPHYLRQARWAARQFGLADRVTFRRGSVYRLAGRAERYDLVLFMGVFYHLRHPLLGLEIVARKASRLLVFQSLTTADEAVAADARRDLDLERRGRLDMPGWPRLAFVEKTLCGDPTNWWVPNHAAILALLRSVGMEVLVQPDHEIYLCRPEPRLAEQARWLQQETRLAAAAAGGG